jgi:hypothetical protein|tara:strand:- start:169 stop:348 length:180 start_codon:yes stop_codon:yes gene_type:complete
MANHEESDGMIKTGRDEKAEARAAADELRSRLSDGVKTASPAIRANLQAQLDEALRKLK